MKSFARFLSTTLYKNHLFSAACHQILAVTIHFEELHRGMDVYMVAATNFRDLGIS